MRRLHFLSLAFLLCAAAYAARAASEPRQASRILHIKVNAAINPVIAEFILEAIERGEKESYDALLIEIDTPGGLDESMREIIKEILNTRLLVVVYVSPPGARAASAGTLITLAADVAAMAPGTNIGAAHPVAMGGQMDKEMEKKVVNDAVAYIKGLARKRGRNEKWAEEAVTQSISTSAEEALKLKVVDLVAANVDELIKKLDGRVVEKDGEPIKFATTAAAVDNVEMSFRQRMLKTLSNPNIAYILMMIGVWGLFFELTNPGAIFPGVIGALCLLVGLYSLHTLPVNYAGMALIGLGIVLLILEVKVTSYGLLTMGGLASMALGSMMLIRSPGPFLSISKGVIFGTVGLTGLVFVFVLFAVIRAQRSAPVSGPEGLVGQTARVIAGVSRSGGKIFLHGEYWEAVSEEPIEPGENARVRSVEGLTIQVERMPKEAS